MKKYCRDSHSYDKVLDEAIGIVFSDFKHRYGFLPDEVIEDDETERYVGGKREINLRVGNTLFYTLRYADKNGSLWGQWEMLVARRIDFVKWSRERGKQTTETNQK